MNSYVFSHWCLCLTLCGVVFFFSRLLYFYDFLSHLLSSLFYGIPMSNTHLTIVLSSKIYTFCVFIMLRTHQKYPKYICFNGWNTYTNNNFLYTTPLCKNLRNTWLNRRMACFDSYLMSMRHIETGTIYGKTFESLHYFVAHIQLNPLSVCRMPYCDFDIAFFFVFLLILQKCNVWAAQLEMKKK